MPATRPVPPRHRTYPRAAAPAPPREPRPATAAATNPAPRTWSRPVPERREFPRR